jgi:transposase
MKCEKYMGMDVHQATTVVVVLDSDGKVVLETIVATEAPAIIRLVQGLTGPLHVTFEETTQAAWLYEVVRAYVAKVIVCDPRRNKLLSEGSKGDKPDALKLAELVAGRAVEIGLSRPCGDSETEGTGPRLRNLVDRHGTDDDSDQVDLSWARNPHTGSGSLPGETAGTVVRAADGAWRAPTGGMTIRRTGSTAWTAAPREIGNVTREPKSSSGRIAENGSSARAGSMRTNRGDL